MSSLHYRSNDARSYGHRGFFDSTRGDSSSILPMMLPKPDLSVRTGTISNREFISRPNGVRTMEFTLNVQGLHSRYQVACIAKGKCISTILGISTSQEVTLKFSDTIIDGRTEMLRIATDDDRTTDITGLWKIRNDVDLDDRPELARMAQEKRPLTIISGTRRGLCRIRTGRSTLIIHRALLSR